MSIFVTGATGVLGRPVVEELGRRGYRVHALCRSPANRKLIIQQGANPEEVDLYDVDALTRILKTCDTVLHLATRIPPSTSMKKPGIWDENDKIRRDGMAAIARAARAAGTIGTMLYPSISYFYGDGGTNWLDANTAVTEPASFLRSTLEAESSVREFADEDSNRRGIILRFGAFYGPQSPDSRQSLSLARKGFFLPLATPSTYRSTIWIDDAAQAVVSAIEHAPTGIYDVVDDVPFTQEQTAGALAAAVGRSKLRTLPRFVLRFVLTSELRDLLARSQRVSNASFCNATGWSPNVPSQAEGWRLVAEAAEGGRKTPHHGHHLPPRSGNSGSNGAMPGGLTASVEKEDISIAT